MSLKSYDKIEALDPSKLTPYDRNSRTHSEAQIAQIVASIKEFGFTNPVLVSDADVIIAGHGRVVAAVQMGMASVPCIRLTGMSEEQRRAYVVADNRLAENAGWDNELLRLELVELKHLGVSMDLIGFDRSALDELFMDVDGLEESGNGDPDAVPEPEKHFTSRAGDVWLCDDHRVMCGDSTSQTDVEKLCASELVDLCWTDPPYNVNYEGTAGVIENDNMGDGAFLEFLTDAFTTASTVMKKGAAIYVAHADTEGRNFRVAFEAAGFKLSGCLVWVKPSLVLGRSDYQWRHEPILYGWKPGAAHRWFGGRKLTTVSEAPGMPFVVTADGRLMIETEEGHIVVSGADLKVEEVVSSVLHHEKPSRSAEHPTMKPVALVLGYVKNSSRRGDLVLDLFGGSGTTMIASQKIGRKARLMELDPRFVDVIVRRWQDFTGGEAVLEGTGQSFADLALGCKEVLG